MDISVSQLNNRLALQLPSELPLGLVFVAGQVSGLVYEADGEGNGRQYQATFNLEQGAHSLRCHLKMRGNEITSFSDGSQIRVGGHLAFDTKQLQYYLLARDVEVIGVDDPVPTSSATAARNLVQGDEALLSALADIKRRSELAQHSQKEMPPWVKKLAPKEVQESLDLDIEGGTEIEATRSEWPPLNEEMVNYLSDLMDSEEEVELTPDMVAQWLPADEPLTVNESHSATAVAEAQTLELKEWADDLANIEEEAETTVNPYDLVGESGPETGSKSTPKSSLRQMDWLVIIAIVALIVFAFALVVAIFVQVMQ